LRVSFRGNGYTLAGLGTGSTRAFSMQGSCWGSFPASASTGARITVTSPGVGVWTGTLIRSTAIRSVAHITPMAALSSSTLDTIESRSPRQLLLPRGRPRIRWHSSPHPRT